MKKIFFLIFSTSLILSCTSAKKVEISVKNPTDMNRANEMVEIPWNQIKEKLQLKENRKLVVLNSSSEQIPYQIASGADTADSLLIFQANVPANGTSTYFVKTGTPLQFGPKAYGRLVPERKDDFAWENDKIAFRVYGPALQATGEISNGIDLWAKRTDKLVIDRWYADDLAGKQSYHHDNGEGLDMYKVGPTLGAGAASPFVNGKIWYCKNFTSYEVLDNGPLRIKVKLHYAPYMADKTEVTETRIISLDAGNQLNKMCVKYQYAGSPLTIAAGIVTHDLKMEQTYTADDHTCFAHAEPNDTVNGVIYEGVTSAQPFSEIILKEGHILGLQQVPSGADYVYYTGGGWSKAGFSNFDDWKTYLQEFNKKIRNPLTVTLK
ncbi:MAG: DUF4861 domain-containing protein [Paludibacteraceae bacterium]